MRLIYLPLLSLCSTILLSTSAANAQNDIRKTLNIIPQDLELAYVKGMQFLSKDQKENGSYGGRNGTRPAIVAVCTMAFLAHGEDPISGPYSKNIQRAIDYIIKSQKKSNGYIGDSMYDHGFATLALAEAYGMMNDPRIEEALVKSVALITSSQNRNSQNGWRYRPDSTSSDSSVAGCQMVALLAARNAGIPVPDQNIEKGLKYLASCRVPNGGYGYSNSAQPNLTLTAISSLCLSLAKQKSDKSFPVTTEFLVDIQNSNLFRYIYYHEYYMAQALFHADETAWRAWNKKNTQHMTSTQLADGSWPTTSRLKEPGCTGFALLSLAVNYRLLPIYEK